MEINEITAQIEKIKQAVIELERLGLKVNSVYPNWTAGGEQRNYLGSLNIDHESK